MNRAKFAQNSRCDKLMKRHSLLLYFPVEHFFLKANILEQLQLLPVSFPPVVREIQAIQIAAYCTEGDFTSCSSLRVCFREKLNTLKYRLLHINSIRIVEWDISCGGKHTGFLPTVAYNTRSGHYNKWKLLVRTPLSCK